jgi:hypothetical protein
MCVCERGKLPKPEPAQYFPQRGKLSSQEENMCLDDSYSFGMCYYRVWYTTEREYCVEIIVYIFPPAILKEPSLLKYMCILCIQYAPVINIYFLSGKLIIIVVPDATVLCFRG